MKLIRVRIQNFRSIVDSTPVDIEERVTVLIGKNEQGKTTFMKGLASFASQRPYTPSDLPNHLRPQLEEKLPAGIPIVTIWLAVEAQVDPQRLTQVIPNIERLSTFKVTRYYDGHYESKAVDEEGIETPISFARPDITSLVSDLKSRIEELRAKLNEHAVRDTAFADGNTQAQSLIADFLASDFSDAAGLDNLIKTFTTALKALPGQDQAIQNEMAAASKRLQSLQADIAQKLAFNAEGIFIKSIPKFFMHSTVLDRIPNDVGVLPFTADPEGTSKGMANLCKAAGLSTQKIAQLSNADTQRREAFEDHYRSRISGGLNEFWTQETYLVYFRIEKEKLSVSISDSTYAPRIAPSERSDGFQWYLSFYSAMLTEVNSAEPPVILLDNPGLELHADGQADIRRFLEEKLPPAQVIYVTHSSAMIDPYNLEQIRKVQLGNPEGTKISNLEFKDAGDLLEPVRSAIGASLVSSLFFNKYNILVEGAADKPILEAAFKLTTTISGDIVINGSIAETKGLLTHFYLQAKLPFVIYLDADSGGRTLKSELTANNIPEQKIAMLDSLIEVPAGTDSELEDALSVDFYHKAVSATYPDKPVQPPTGRFKRTKHYETVFKQEHKIGFSKKRVAETLKRLLLETGGDDESRSNLQKVTTGLRGKLKTE
jgi:predicted ATP-dependent endonuclease of OLD family